jgi:hypothetical protein
VKPVYAFGGKGNSRVEAKGNLGPVQIIVDGLGYADNSHTFFGKAMSDGHRTIATYGNQGIELVFIESSHQIIGSIHSGDLSVGICHRKVKWMTAIGGSQDCAAQMRNAADTLATQGYQATARVVSWKQQPIVAVPNSETLPTTLQRSNHSGTDHGVEAWCITASC